MLPGFGSVLLFLTPAVSIPLALLGSVNLVLQLSLGFLIWHLFVAALAGLVPSVFEKWGEALLFVELPCIFTLVSVVYAGMPELVVSLYHSLLQFSGPLALILVSIQLPRIVMFTSRLLCEKIDEQPTTMKVIILVSSLLAYVMAGGIVFWLYQHPAIDVASASCLSIVTTLLVVLTLLTLFVDEMNIMDTAMISLSVLLYMKSAFNSLLVLQPHATATTASFWTNIFAEYTSKVMHVAAAPPTAQSTLSPFVLSSVVSLDFVVEGAFLVACLITLPMPLPLDPLDRELELEGDASLELGPQLRKRMFKAGMIFLYTYLALCASGDISAVGLTWRITQVFATMTMYMFQVLRLHQAASYC